MKRIHQLSVCIFILAICACNDKPADHYASVPAFLTAHKAPVQTYTMNGNTGGNFTTPQGTIVTVPPNAFVTQSNTAVTGAVTIYFKDIYTKSEMVLSDMPTMLFGGAPLVSGGEFFIKATSNNAAVQLAPGKKITVAQPNAVNDTANAMQPFVIAPDSVMPNGDGWHNSATDSINYVAGYYMFSLYQFTTPVDSGSWCNSDNSSYFSAYPITTLTLQPDEAINTYHTQVFLLYTNLHSMVHVYDNGTNFPYYYAPQGLSCTVVATGVNNGALYSAFVPITIGMNQTVHFSLQQTTTSDFLTALDALN